MKVVKQTKRKKNHVSSSPSTIADGTSGQVTHLYLTAALSNPRRHLGTDEDTSMGHKFNVTVRFQPNQTRNVSESKQLGRCYCKEVLNLDLDRPYNQGQCTVTPPQQISPPAYLQLPSASAWTGRSWGPLEVR